MNCANNASSAAEGPASPPDDPRFLQLGLWTAPPPPPSTISLQPPSTPSEAPFISECLIKEQGKGKPDGDYAQLTIFYGGAVHVFDKVPTHKAQALMVLVRSQQKSDSNTTNQAKHDPSLNPFNVQDATQTMKRRSHKELPFARKASFARFLKTRKARVEEAMQLKREIQEKALQKTCDPSQSRLCNQES